MFLWDSKKKIVRSALFCYLGNCSIGFVVINRMYERTIRVSRLESAVFYEFFMLHAEIFSPCTYISVYAHLLPLPGNDRLTLGTKSFVIRIL